MVMAELRTRVMELAPRERVEIAYELLNSVDPALVEEYDAELDAKFAEEIERRVNEIRDGTAVTYAAEDVFNELRALFPGEDAPAEHRAWAEEMRRRMDEQDAGVSGAISMDEVFAEVRAFIKEHAQPAQPEE